MDAVIAGGGIAGFTAALCLHAKGISVELFERTPSIRELGVGINILPHATKVFDKLGLTDRLNEIGIETFELIFCNRQGQRIWREPRGRDAGYRFPQYSIHRGKLQGALYEAVKERIGDQHVHAGHELIDVAQNESKVTAQLKLRDGTIRSCTADVLIGADGIHSRARSVFYPEEGDPIWSGSVFWRGATEWSPFLTGRSMIISGGMKGKLVLYPISGQVSRLGKTLMNWAVFMPVGLPGEKPPRRESWDRTGRLEELLPFVQATFRNDHVDVVELMKATPEFFEYPICDREPLGRWSFGRVTLIGDAAHPMYPMGSNGASQAIIDADDIAERLACAPSVATALQGYDAARVPMLADIVRSNRKGGNERVIDLVEARAPNGFGDLHEVVSEEELASVVAGYSAMAKFNKAEVNR